MCGGQGAVNASLDLLRAPYHAREGRGESGHGNFEDVNLRDG